jgi:peptidoglycan-associated lipoprotein
MANVWLKVGVCVAVLLSAACAPKRAAVPPPPPPARQNIFALLPEPNGAVTGIVVRNQAGARELTQPDQAVRVERADVAPGAPFSLDQAEVRRLFGSAIDVLPAPEIQFVLHFDEGRDVLTPESQALMPAILAAIRERHSTAITVTGHTDTVDTPRVNYQLGLRRAQTVTTILERQGVNTLDLFVSSHGDADLLEKTGRGVANAQNRRVEVIIR